MSLSKISNRGTIGAAIVGAVFAALIVGSGLIYAKSHAYECQPQTEQHDAESNLGAPPINDGGAKWLDDDAEQHQERETCFWGHNAEQWLALLTLWLVAGTALLAAFTAFLWLDAGEAARKQRRADRDAHRRELRAYVCADGDTRTMLEGIGVDVVLENTGLTPAIACTSRISRNHFDPAIPDDFSYEDDVKESEPPAPVFVIGPRQKVKFTIGVFKPEDIDRLARRVQGRMYGWGWIDYSDIFGKRHRTEFCFEVEGIVSQTAEGRPVVSARPRHGPDYNSSDEYCRRKPSPRPKPRA